VLPKKKKKKKTKGNVMKVNLKLQRQRSGGLRFEASPGKQFVRPYLKKTKQNKNHTEKGW
jgi:hypothetical protein